MPREQAEPLSRAEWKVMNIVWRHKRCAARDVYEEAGREHGWAPSTVKTLLRRLVDKGHLQTSQIGNSFLYRPTRPALQALRRAADALLQNALDGTVGPLLAHMVQCSKLSAHELAQLRALLDERQPDEPG
ncbi:MAG TPA: BlaI/MecI/CopY family transcriptional regulator [Pirellulales bacterium]|jgi:predicted transcriptional regulator|nr:BlaI/MecI/CopY family transcriptional regulator [Pirellulales bacterium]